MQADWPEATVLRKLRVRFKMRCHSEGVARRICLSARKSRFFASLRMTHRLILKPVLSTGDPPLIAKGDYPRKIKYTAPMMHNDAHR
jgi:hypothetical protein